MAEPLGIVVLVDGSAPADGAVAHAVSLVADGPTPSSFSSMSRT
jgi:hypothetical protein